MVRPYRLQAEGCFYHITSRGNDRKRIFLHETDFEKFLEYILKAKGKYDFYLFAYVLMSNHYQARKGGTFVPSVLDGKVEGDHSSRACAGFAD